MSAQTIDVDLAAAGKLGNGFLIELNRLRESDPIHWSDASRCWLVTRHADINDALQGKFPLSLKRLVSIGLGAIPEADRARLFPTIMRFMPGWIIELDPPDHTRIRKLLIKAFSKKVVENVRPFARERIASLLSKLRAQPAVEFNEEIARQLPGSVILKLLGLPQEHIGRLRGWSNALQQGIGVPFATVDALKAADEAMADMNSIVIPAIEERRRHPQDDLLTAMIQAVEGGETLSLDEMLGSLHVIIVAGHDTTSNSLSLGVAALARHPDVWDYLYRNPDRSLEVSLEIMRYIAMSTSQPRIVAESFEWHGKQLMRGDLVFLMLAAGNRDPRTFDHPEVLNPQRDNEKSMVFAPGLHHCIGHLLAKMQVSEFFASLVSEFAGVELRDESLHFMPQIAFRGLHDLHTRFTPRMAGVAGV